MLLALTYPNEPVPVFAITSPLALTFFEAVKLPCTCVGLAENWILLLVPVICASDKLFE